MRRPPSPSRSLLLGRISSEGYFPDDGSYPSSTPTAWVYRTDHVSSKVMVGQNIYPDLDTAIAATLLAKR